MKKAALLILWAILTVTLFSCVAEIPEKLVIENTENNIVENKGETRNDAESEIVAVEQERQNKTSEEDSEAKKLVKAFYEEFFAQEEENESFDGRMGNAERLEVVKRKYLTENLIEELHLRTRQYSADAITNSQDDIPLRGKLIFSNGKDENTGCALYREEFENGGYAQDVFELHFIDTPEGKRANALNVYHEDDDGNGSKLTYERITQYAIHGDFTEEDKAEMESIKKELDDLEKEGFIG